MLAVALRRNVWHNRKLEQLQYHVLGTFGFVFGFGFGFGIGFGCALGLVSVRFWDWFRGLVLGCPLWVETETENNAPDMRLI